jgi:hypothetical protein
MKPQGQILLRGLCKVVFIERNELIKCNLGRQRSPTSTLSLSDSPQNRFFFLRNILSRRNSSSTASRGNTWRYRETIISPQKHSIGIKCLGIVFMSLFNNFAAIRLYNYLCSIDQYSCVGWPQDWRSVAWDKSQEQVDNHEEGHAYSNHYVGHVAPCCKMFIYCKPVSLFLGDKLGQMLPDWLTKTLEY